MHKKDVIIVGASFAGLAVAAQLRGERVLLIDRKSIGAGQTSTCATLVRTLEALALEDAILQVHDRIVLHTPGRTFVFPVAEPFCTFDYGIVCWRLWEQGDGELVKAAALRVDGPVVYTSRGSIAAEIIVDASGWRAVAGSQAAPKLLRPDRLSFGIETVAPMRDDELHFWYDPTRLLPAGITWVFPIGDSSRVGIASYRGDSRLGSGLNHFLDRLGLDQGRVHGGYIAHGLREPVVGNLFLVGDAAG
jgi:menaquinone-9 beta-reductase